MIIINGGIYSSLISQALEMIHNIRNAFYELLTEADWMDEKTRVVARGKVQTQ